MARRHLAHHAGAGPPLNAACQPAGILLAGMKKDVRICALPDERIADGDPLDSAGNQRGSQGRSAAGGNEVRRAIHAIRRLAQSGSPDVQHHRSAVVIPIMQAMRRPRGPGSNT